MCYPVNDTDVIGTSSQYSNEETTTETDGDVSKEKREASPLRGDVYHDKYGPGNGHHGACGHGDGYQGNHHHEDGHHGGGPYSGGHYGEDGHHHFGK